MTLLTRKKENDSHAVMGFQLCHIGSLKVNHPGYTEYQEEWHKYQQPQIPVSTQGSTWIVISTVSSHTNEVYLIEVSLAMPTHATSLLLSSHFLGHCPKPQTYMPYHFYLLLLLIFIFVTYRHMRSLRRRHSIWPL